MTVIVTVTMCNNIEQSDLNTKYVWEYGHYVVKNALELGAVNQSRLVILTL